MIYAILSLFCDDKLFTLILLFHRFAVPGWPNISAEPLTRAVRMGKGVEDTENTMEYS